MVLSLNQQCTLKLSYRSGYLGCSFEVGCWELLQSDDSRALCFILEKPPLLTQHQLAGFGSSVHSLGGGGGGHSRNETGGFHLSAEETVKCQDWVQ